MTKKINLTVPDDLAERMEARRDYLGNLSGLFQEAVKEKLDRKEALEKRIAEGGESMEATVARLRKEKAAAEKDYHEGGMKEGVDWAKNSSYTDLQYMLGFDPIEPRNQEYFVQEFTGNEVLGEGFQECFSNDPALINTDPNSTYPDILSNLGEKWFEGWKEGVRTFWQQVRTKL